jgi:hypothetical protein
LGSVPATATESSLLADTHRYACDKATAPHLDRCHRQTCRIGALWHDVNQSRQSITGRKMMMNGFGGGMGFGAGIGMLLILVLVVLAIAGLIKYLRS